MSETDRPLGLRIGLSAGEVTQEADDYFGEPVIEAALHSVPEPRPGTSSPRIWSASMPGGVARTPSFRSVRWS